MLLTFVLSMALMVNPPRIKDILQGYLIKNYHWAEVQVRQTRVDGQIPQGIPERIDVLKGPLGRASFIFVYPSGRRVKVEATIRAKEYVLVTTAPLRKGESPTAGTLATNLVDVQRMPSDAITRIEDIKGLRAKYNIMAGTILRRGMFEREPLLKKGQKVTILYQKGGVRITAPGVLREDGIEGMTVKVINLATKKVLMGVVRKDGVVDVTP